MLLEGEDRMIAAIAVARQRHPMRYLWTTLWEACKISRSRDLFNLMQIKFLFSVLVVHFSLNIAPLWEGILAWLMVWPINALSTVENSHRLR